MHIHDGAVNVDFAEVLHRLSAAYGGNRLTEDRVRIYAAALGDVSITEVRRACSRAIRECKFMPSVADLRMYVSTPMDDAALIAWTALCQAVESAGPWVSIVVEDACAAGALASVFGGWPQFTSQADDGPALTLRRAEFMAMYRTLRRLQRAKLAPARLIGLCEAQSPEMTDAQRQATLCWRITDAGALEQQHDSPRLHGHQQTGLPEGTDPQATQNQAPPDGSGRHHHEPGGGRAA